MRFLRSPDTRKLAPFMTGVMTTMNPESQLKEIFGLLNFLDKKLDGLKIVDGQDSRASAALLHLSLEHFGAIADLLDQNLCASAISLLRLQYETLVRAMYFFHCATEEEAEKFMAGKEPPKIMSMISSLEGKPGFKSGFLSRVHAREWRSMNSYTHGGSEQVTRRYAKGDLASHFTDSDKLGLIKAAKAIALMAATHAAIVYGTNSLAIEIQRRFGVSNGDNRES